MTRDRLRTTFEEVPELYDRARPSYPEGLFADLVRLARLADGARILEVGCGTGKATVAFAARGFEIVCVELGEQLAAVARRNLAAFPRVRVANAAFETWEEDGFDAVVAFTAWHWIDPSVRYQRAARALVDGGRLAVVSTEHVLLGGGDQFFTAVQADYEAVTPEGDNRPPPPPQDVGDLSGDIDASGFFENVAVRRHLWDVEYTADDYLAVLDTYSGHRALDEERRRLLYERIRRRIESRPGRTVRKTYLATLNVARRL